MGVSSTTAVLGAAGALRGRVIRAQDSSETPVLFVHPINTRGSCWSQVADRLTPERDVYMFDLRGHGDSDPHGPFGVQEWADDCLAILDNFELETVDVVGGSLGGPIAVALAAQQPQRIKSITAFGSTLKIEGEGLDDVLTALRAKGVRGMFAEVIPELSVAPGTSGDVIRRVLEDTNPNSVEIVSAIWRATLAADVTALAKNVMCPCLSVSGAEDRTCPVSQGMEMARLLRGEHRILAGVGHLPMYEKPQAVAEVVAEFTKRVTGSAEALGQP